MSIAAPASGFTASRTGTARGVHPAAVVLAAFAMSLVLSWPRLLEIWAEGQFYDTDDAMRLVQVRAWLAGQGWFDLVAHRLHPPDGLLMHWSRVVDVPLGGLIRLFALATDQARAETLARIVFPLALQLALIAAVVRLGLVLEGAALVAAALAVGSGFMFEQFPPGRIDHHAPQIVLLVASTAALLGSLGTGQARRAALCGLGLSVSLAISLENLPFFAVLLAALPLVWIARPGNAREPLLWLAGGLASCAPVLFAATVPPSRYGVAVGDAFSLPHLTAVLAGAAGFAVLASLTPRLATVQARALAVAVAGGAVLTLSVALFPSVLHGPYGDMDPVVRRLWLSHVTEAEPLVAAARREPALLFTLACPSVVGALGSVLAVRREAGLARVRWMVVLALTIVGLIGTAWEIRVATSVQPLGLLGGVYVVSRLLAWAERRPSPLRGVAVVLSLAPFATLAWAFLPAPTGDRVSAASLARASTCRRPESMAALSNLPRSLIFAPIDDGSHLQVHTPHSVVAAPYHRNQVGNRTVLDGFLASPEAAEPIVRGSGARYVAICPGEAEITVLSREAPGGLAATLADGQVPSWLEAVPLAGTPYRVFAVR